MQGCDASIYGCNAAIYGWGYGWVLRLMGATRAFRDALLSFTDAVVYGCDADIFSDADMHGWGADESTPISAAVRERGGGRGGWETLRVGEWGLALALCIAATFA
eukprot:702508-Rhodomonas_salina.1